MPIETLHVTLPQTRYPIYIGEHVYADVTLLERHVGGKQVLLVSNETVASLYLAKLQQVLSAYHCDVLVLPDGESHKTLQSWSRLLDALAQGGHHRDSTLITLGGGVIGDMGGFAAATYQRGIPFIQIPTTLLAQVDASIGGKTAINHAVGKNLIGAFHQPLAVIIDLHCLRSLPEREFRAGLAEVVKAALIADDEFFAWLESHCQPLLSRDHEALRTAIRKACTIKRDIVVADEKEMGVRALLNLGHTFAHAIERLCGYGLYLHGEAVAIGLVMAADLSYRRGQISADDQRRIASLLQRMQLPITLPQGVRRQDLLASMQMDKKVKQGKLRFVLLNALGNAVIADDVCLDEIVIDKDGHHA